MLVTHKIVRKLRDCASCLKGMFPACLIMILCLPWLTLRLSAEDNDNLTIWPEPPYRGWYQPPWIVDEPELYEHANLTTAENRADRAAVLNQRGIAALRWAYGPQSPYADNDPAYFHNYLDPARHDDDYIWAGFGIDEWNTGSSRVQEQKESAAEGYRLARAEWPDNFVACWVTSPCELFIELVRDGTFDLAMIEGYHWWFNNPGVGIGYEATLNRVQRLREAGVSNRTVVGWGHVSAGPDQYGREMTREQVEHRVIESRERYPEMPGIVFMSTGRADNQETRELIRYADRLSGEYYPDPPPEHEQKKIDLPVNKVFATDNQSTSEVLDQQIILHAKGPDKLELKFDMSKLSELDEEIVSAELVLSATAVDNPDRRVLRIFAGCDDLDGDHPADARIWYEPGMFRFDVTRIFRDWQSGERPDLESFIINDIPTGWNPPEEENWSITLARSKDFNGAFGSINLHAIPEPCTLVFFGLGSLLLIMRRKWGSVNSETSGSSHKTIIWK